MSRAPSTALEVRGAEKSFGATRALAAVDLRVEQGAIHALLGGNGSGKSTLIKLLAGVVAADDGEATVGTTVADLRHWTPGAARSAGLRFVHQDPGVFPGMSVAENLALGSGYAGSALRVDWRRQRRAAAQVLRRFGIDVDPATRIGDLGPATRTMVAIARALQDRDRADEGVLVLDEPTASLPRSEVEVLLAALRRYAANGQAIVFVSHRLDEVLHLADTVSVLRDGRHVATRAAADLDERELARLIAGAPVLTPVAATSTDRSTDRTAVPALEVRGLSVGPLRDLDLTVRRGQVLGVAGLLGSGRSTLLRAVCGDVRVDAGEVRVAGAAHRPRSPRDAVRRGVVYLPEDRAASAAFPGMSVRWNLTIPDVGRHWRRWRLDHRGERRVAAGDLVRFGVKAGHPEDPITTLSGGNQQKVVLGRWLRLDPAVLLLDEPTQGVDVGARAQIYAMVRDAAARGAAVLVVSSDLAEILEYCDDVAVLRGGRVVDVRASGELDVERLVAATITTRKAS